MDIWKPLTLAQHVVFPVRTPIQMRALSLAQAPERVERG